MLSGRTFRGLEHLNETTAWWLAEVADVRVHRQTKARPIDRHAEERPHLIPLPAQPFDAAEVVYRTVDAEGFVVYRQNFYSAPWRLIGQTVAVRVTEDELVIHDQAFVEAARHRALPADRRGPAEPLQGPRAAPRRATAAASSSRSGSRSSARRARGSWRACSPATGSARTRPSASCRWRRPTRAPTSWRRWSGPCGTARSACRPSRRILAVRGRPKTPLDVLADDHRTYLDRLLDGEPTPPRPTSDYQALLGEDPHDAEPTDPETPTEPPAEGPDDQDGGGIEPP